MKKLLTIFFLIGFSEVFSQDSIRTLSLPEYLKIVRSYHPIAKQANLLLQEARATVTAARGAFDPVLDASFGKKKFAGLEYYQYWNPEVRIPTWYGVEIRGGLEEVYGERVNNETTLGQSSYLGLTVPLARNLLIDQRRAALQQAKIFRSQSDADRSAMLNDLLFDASVAYWNWAASYQFYQVVSNLVRISNDRFEFVKIGYRQGDRPAIDTTEALAQLQSFQSILVESEIDLRNNNLLVSNFLWLENDSAYALPATVIPDSTWKDQALPALPTSTVDQIVSDAMVNHPLLRSYNFKLQSLEIDRRYKFQSLLPYINVKGNLLNKGYNVVKGVDAAFMENNYRIGLDIVIPLRFSQGRGDYQKARIKIADTQYELNNKTRQIENKIRAYYNELNGLKEQVSINEMALINYSNLLRGEDTRFRLGESSVFLLNTRENKLLEIQQKTIDLRAKYNKTLSALQWSAGFLK